MIFVLQKKVFLLSFPEPSTAQSHQPDSPFISPNREANMHITISNLCMELPAPTLLLAIYITEKVYNITL